MGAQQPAGGQQVLRGLGSGDRALHSGGRRSGPERSTGVLRAGPLAATGDARSGSDLDVAPGDARSQVPGQSASPAEPAPSGAVRRGRPRVATAPRAQPAPLPETELAGLRDAVCALLKFAAASGDPLDRAHAQTALLAELGGLTTWVAHSRDAAIVELLASMPNASSRRIAPLLGVTRQRVDQLRQHLARGQADRSVALSSAGPGRTAG